MTDDLLLSLVAQAQTCEDHHMACPCRELHFELLTARERKLRAMVEQLLRGQPLVLRQKLVADLEQLDQQFPQKEPKHV